MNRSGLFVLTIALLSFCGMKTPASADELGYIHQQKLSYLGIGVGGVAISSSEASLSSFALDLNYRRSIMDTKFNYFVQVAPIFQSTSLFGLQGTAALGYQIYGSTQISTQYSDEGQNVLSQITPDTVVKGFVDAGLTILPVFGSNSTASYSGIFFDASVYSSKYMLDAALQANFLTLGSRSIKTIGLFLNYYWNFR
jgi:hypothetical protein